MTERENIIRGLEQFRADFKPFCGNGADWERFDAGLDLLKEQEAIKPIYNEEKYGDHLPRCGRCEKVLPNNAMYGKVNFCHYCGHAVKWNE